MPTWGSATCMKRLLAEHRDDAVVAALEKLPAIGMTANVRNAGTSDRYGASLNTNGSAVLRHGGPP